MWFPLNCKKEFATNDRYSSGNHFKSSASIILPCNNFWKNNKGETIRNYAEIVTKKKLKWLYYSDMCHENPSLCLVKCFVDVHKQNSFSVYYIHVWCICFIPTFLLCMFVCAYVWVHICVSFKFDCYIFQWTIFIILCSNF